MFHIHKYNVHAMPARNQRGKIYSLCFSLPRNIYSCIVTCTPADISVPPSHRKHRSIKMRITCYVSSLAATPADLKPPPGPLQPPPQFRQQSSPRRPPKPGRLALDVDGASEPEGKHDHKVLHSGHWGFFLSLSDITLPCVPLRPCY